MTTMARSVIAPLDATHVTDGGRRFAIWIYDGKRYAQQPCSRCGGTGIYSQFHGTCYRCAGEGIDPTPQRVYTQEEWDAREARLQAANERRIRRHLEARERALAEAEATYPQAYGICQIVTAVIEKLDEHDEFADAGIRHFGSYLRNLVCADALGGAALNPKLAELIERAWETFLQRQRERAATREASQHVGAVGERLDLTASVEAVIDLGKGQWGRTTLVKFIDDAGNVLVWFASGHAPVEKGERVALRGTVKAHNERDGVKQTQLTRCKVKEAR